MDAEKRARPKENLVWVKLTGAGALGALDLPCSQGDEQVARSGLRPLLIRVRPNGSEHVSIPDHVQSLDRCNEDAEVRVN